MFSDLYLSPMAMLESFFYASIKNFDGKAILSEGGQRPTNTEITTVRNGIAIIDIKGPIFETNGFFSMFFSSTSPQLIATELSKSIEDSAIKGVVLNIDSPGGQVKGISELSDMIYSYRSKKPIISYISGIGASAAYWIASASDMVVVNDTAGAGSIGVVIGYRKNTNSNTIEIVSSASPNKRIDPETDAGLALIQERADSIADVFVGAVAKYRGAQVDYVKENYGKGNVLIGKHAVKSGLADKLGTLEGVLREFETNTKFKEALKMQEIKTLDELKTAHSGLVIEAEEKAVEASSAKIMEFVKMICGDDLSEKVSKIMASGITPEQFQAVKALGPSVAAVTPEIPTVTDDDAVKASLLEALKTSGAENPGAGSITDPKGPEDFDEAVNAIMQDKNISLAKAVRVCVEKYPELHDKKYPRPTIQ